jgi:hypothetical protein
VVGAAAAAFSMPHKVVRAAVATALGDSGSSSEAAGPIRIVRESGHAADRGAGVFVTFLGTLAAYLWPFAAGVVLLDALSSWLFRRMYPETTPSSLVGYGFERQRQALLLVYAGYAVLALYPLGIALGTSWAILFALLATAPFAAVGPLTWIVGRQFWSRSSVVLCMLLSFFVPCVAFLVVYELRSQLQRALRADGFRVTWLRVIPPSAE